MKAIFFLLLLGLPAAAADKEIPVGGEAVAKPGTRVIYKRKTSINFDDAIVEGAASNPEGVYVVTPPEKQFGSLLKLRPNFHRELMRDSLLLK